MLRLSKALICTHLSMTQSDLPYTIDQLLNRRPFNCTVQPLSSPQRGVLFGDNLKGIFQLRFRGNKEQKHIGVRLYRRSRATRAGSGQWPSPPTASRSCLDQGIAQSGSGTQLQVPCSRRSRATRARSVPWHSPPTASRLYLDRSITQCGSGTLLPEPCCRRERVSRPGSIQ